MGPFNCANWYHSRVIPRESGARAAAGPASKLSAQPHLACALRSLPNTKTHWMSPHHTPTRPHSSSARGSPASTGLGLLHGEGPRGHTGSAGLNPRAHASTRPTTGGCSSDVSTLLSSLLSPIMAPPRPQRCSWLSSAAARCCLLLPRPSWCPFLWVFQLLSLSTLLWGAQRLALRFSPGTWAPPLPHYSSPLRSCSLGGDLEPTERTEAIALAWVPPSESSVKGWEDSALIIGAPPSPPLPGVSGTLPVLKGRLP